MLGRVNGPVIRVVFGVAPLLLAASLAQAQKDPGVRGGAPGAGGPIPGLTATEARFFDDGLDTFQEVDGVADGLGPRFNLNSCGGCHVAPAVGGTSPASNPQVNGGVAPAAQVNNLVDLGLISGNGPVREIRFKSDDAVHDLFTIAGLPGTPSTCDIRQPNFAQHKSEIIFRIPTPVFGAGLIEAIPEAAILANVGGKPFGIKGRANRNGNDNTVTRFGWKAQNKSLVVFSGEAYSVEQGVSNEMFQDERGEGGVPDPAACLVVPISTDHTNFDAAATTDVPSDVIRFANFMRFTAAPTPSCTVGVDCPASVNSGSALFDSTGCAVCHIRSLKTGNHDTAALANKTANLFSDLLVHNMGQLGDGISQGVAGPNDFRTAPLWGVGQRRFFLHDGRTSDLLEAIEAHSNGGEEHDSSEAEVVTRRFNALSAQQKQDILNFLRTL